MAARPAIRRTRRRERRHPPHSMSLRLIWRPLHHGRRRPVRPRHRLHPADTRAHRAGAQIDLATGCAAIDLAAPSGWRPPAPRCPWPLPATPAKRPGSEIVLALDTGANDPVLTAEGRVMTLSAQTAAYLANVYPYLHDAASGATPSWRRWPNWRRAHAASVQDIRPRSNWYRPRCSRAAACPSTGAAPPRPRSWRAGVPLRVGRRPTARTTSRLRRLAEEIVLPYLAQHRPLCRGRR